MSADTSFFAPPNSFGRPEIYRTLSKTALLSLALGLLGFAGFLFSSLLILPLVGLGLGIVSLVNIRRYPEELSGKLPATAGLLLCLVTFAGGVGFHSYIYATEVPPGYSRVSFVELQPQPERPDLPVAPAALELDGEQVFIKGYVYPDGQQRNIRTFVLVPDMGTCCFGGQPKLTDMIQVTLQEPLKIEYTRRKRKLGGVLKVSTQKKPVSGLDGVYYQLEADYLK